MRVLSRSSALLSDYEVLALLNDTESRYFSLRKAEKRRARDDDQEEEIFDGLEATLTLEEEEKVMQQLPQNVREVVFQAKATLEERHRGSSVQSEESVRGFLDALKEAGFTGPPGPRGRRRGILTKAEQLQILNHVPSAEVELFMIIDGYTDRLEEQDREELFSIISQHLPRPLSTTEAADAAAEAAAQAEARMRSDAASRLERTLEEDEDMAMNSVGGKNAARKPKRKPKTQEMDIDEDAAIVQDGDEFIHEGKTEAIDADEKEED